MKTTPLHLLMVDDMQEDIDLFRSLFEDTAPDFRFSSALSAKSALRHLETVGVPDLILLDLSLPDVTGHEFLAHLKAEPGLKLVPVIILTASDREHDVLKASHGFASAYLVKPATHEDCRAMIQALQGFWRQVRLPRAPDDLFLDP